LPERLSSPLKSLPPRIDRDPPIHYDIPFQIISGTSGIGKTRAAMDIASKLAETTQATTVYLARGYVNASARLPEKGPRRKVVVLIDDYDYGCGGAASTSFEERQAAYSEALENLSKLYRIVESKVEICGFIVTINSNRLHLVSEDVHLVLPAFEFCKLHPVSVTEYNEFLKSLASMLGISFDVDAAGILEKACDGRFDTVAIFLSQIPKGTAVKKQEAERYLQVQKSVWNMFRQHLSAQQQLVYDCIKTLRDFGIPARIEYIHQMTQRESSNTMDASQIRDALTSLWDIQEDRAIVYDGQFEPALPKDDSVEIIVKACLAAGHILRRKKRYFYQLEMKELMDTLVKMSQDKRALTLLRKLNSWYPRDRYFAFQLANVYSRRGQYLRAMWHLYRIFRKPDVMVVYSGKWIEVRAHLLLAHIYQSMGMYRLRHDWNWHKRIEQEFNMAASLADLEIPDVGSNGFEYVGSLGKEESPLVDPKNPLKEHLHELGYSVPEGKSLNAKHLRAIVHHSYSAYLLSQFHQEHRAIHHEVIVTQILPDYGEAYLNCAKACLQLGDSQRAVTFLNQAASASPQYLDQVTYSFMVSSYRYQAYADLGQIEIARKHFAECRELTNVEPLSSDEKLNIGLARLEQDNDYWDRYARLASHREKRFGDAITYRLLDERIKIVLPTDWKIFGENCSKSDEESWMTAGFASPLTWDDKTRTPSDAIVTLTYSMEAKHLTQDAPAFGLWYLECQVAAAKKKKSKYSWKLEEGPLNLGNATFSQWLFKIHARWSKTGRIMVFALPRARVLLQLMWEDSGSATFSPIMESIATPFRSQEVFLGVPPLKGSNKTGPTSKNPS
jgi:tetratricopeptide (TPR) repeat protein